MLFIHNKNYALQPGLSLLPLTGPLATPSAGSWARSGPSGLCPRSPHQWEPTQARPQAGRGPAASASPGSRLELTCCTWDKA